MKRFLVVLLILAVAAGGVFAQELKLTGEVRSGLTVTQSKDVSDGDPFIFVHSPAGDHAWRLTLNGAYTNADKTAGFNFNLRSHAVAATSDASMNADTQSTYAENARAWMKVLDNKITFFGGKTDDVGVLGTKGAVDAHYDLGGGRGLFTRAENLVENLTLGFGLYPNTGLNNPVKLDAANYRFGATYTIPDTVTIGAVYVKNAYQLNASLGIQVLALKSVGLTGLVFDAALDRLDDDVVNKARIGEKFTFVSGDLEIGGRFVQALKLGKDKDKESYAMDLSFTAYGLYKLNEGKIIPKLGVGYNIGSDNGGNIRFGEWDSLGKNDHQKESNNLVVTPSVEFRLGGSANQAFILGYSLINSQTGTTVGTTTTTTTKTSANVVFVDYKVSF